MNAVISQAPGPLAIPDLQTGLQILSRLPLANPLQAEGELNRFLDSLLQEPPEPAVYLTLLEQTRVPLCFVEEELARRYVGKPLPVKLKQAALPTPSAIMVTAPAPPGE